MSSHLPQEKALVGAFSVLTNLQMELFQALVSSDNCPCTTVSLLYRDFTIHHFWGFRNCLFTYKMFSGKRESMQSLELSFPVTASHFHNNKVRLKCLATIAGHRRKYLLLRLLFAVATNICSLMKVTLHQ